MRRNLLPSVLIVFALVSISVSGCVGEKKESQPVSPDAQMQNSDASSNETNENGMIRDERTAPDANGSCDASEFRTVVDEDDMITWAHSAQIICVETEKQHDGRWFVYPFKRATEIRAELSWEPTQTCKELGLFEFEPTNGTDTSKQYSIKVESDAWGTPFIFMAVPISASQQGVPELGVAKDMKYHIKILCNGVPPLPPTHSEKMKMEGDITADVSLLDMIKDVQTFSYPIKIPQNAVRIDVNLSWSPENEWLMFRVENAAGEMVAFRGQFGFLSSIPAPSPPLSTSISPVRNPGDWTVYVEGHVNAACHYVIEITIYT